MENGACRRSQASARRRCFQRTEGCGPLTGYDPVTQLWCANVPTLRIPERPTRAEAEAGLRLLRETFRTFPFSDASRRKDEATRRSRSLNLDQRPGMDESTFLVGLLTAICRPSLWLAPGLLVRAPEISGAGTGKGLLVRSICAIAFGVQPRAFTKGGDRQELDKRLASELIEAAPILFLDNVNGTMLRSDTLASVLTERPARVRALGRTQMVSLNSTAFIALTGNGLSVSEDLARRFIVCELDARCEDPEQRKFASGLLDEIERHRAELLAAALDRLALGSAERCRSRARSATRQLRTVGRMVPRSAPGAWLSRSHRPD